MPRWLRQFSLGSHGECSRSFELLAVVTARCQDSLPNFEISATSPTSAPAYSATTARSLPANSSCRSFPVNFVQSTKFVFAQADRRRGDVFLEMLYRRGSGNWQHPRRTLQQPCARDLNRFGMMDLRDAGQKIMSNCSGSKRKPWNEGDAVLLAIIDDVFPFAVEDAVAVLNSNDWGNFLRPLNVFTSYVGQSDQVHLAFCFQPGYRLDRCLDGNY